MHATKRRRQLDTHATLTKPFRSPLQKRTKTSGAALHSSDAGSQVTTPGQEYVSTPPHASNPPPSLSGDASPVKTVQPALRSAVPRSSQPSSEYLALQKQHSALLMRLKHLRGDLDTATQALQIASSARDVELEELIGRWRFIARDCAEELFASAKDRINRMGGVGVWRERYQRPLETSTENGWAAAEDEVNEDELTPEQKEQLEIARDEARRERERYQGTEHETHDERQRLQQKAGSGPPRDDDSFTMDTMLRQLNVDLDAVGYDAVQQRWKF